MFKAPEGYISDKFDWVLQSLLGGDIEVQALIFKGQGCRTMHQDPRIDIEQALNVTQKTQVPRRQQGMSADNFGGLLE